jgi:hypothetical protein
MTPRQEPGEVGRYLWPSLLGWWPSVARDDGPSDGLWSFPAKRRCGTG